MLWAWAVVPTSPHGACGASKEAPRGKRDNDIPAARAHRWAARDPYCHMQIKKGGVWMGLKRSEMGVTGNSINTASGL
jgi:hypothetical protein